VKTSAAGTPVWARRMGGSLSDYAYTVAFDRAGDVIVAGEFQGTVDFGCGPLSNPPGNSFNAFVVKYAGSSGSCLWSKGLGGAYRDTAYAVATDGANNVLVTGGFWGTVDFGGTSLTSHSSLNYDPDIFILKLDASGRTVWARGGFGAGAYDV